MTGEIKYRDVSFPLRVKEVIKSIPAGKVATYGQVAAMAGDPYAARLVVWVLHSSSEKDRLPWHRVVNRYGKISLIQNQDYQRQKTLLQKEGIRFDAHDVIDLNQYLWSPG